MEPTFRISEILTTLVAGRELPAQQLRGILAEMMAGRQDEAEAAAFLAALRVKGETAGEIACAAQVMRDHMVRWNPERSDVLDTCGTGGDGTGTFNISSATALVVAAAGVPVVKHGNRSVSSRSGSADVLAELGVKIDGDADFARRSLRETGFAFCFAPIFHPAMKHVGGLRKKLGIPTIFNCLGPLANPAGADRQLLGVGRRDLLDRMAEALARLGTKHAVVLCGTDGLDEVSLSAATLVREVCGSEITRHEWTPADFGLEPCSLSELRADTIGASADIIKKVIVGVSGPAERVVVANAAAALIASGRVGTLPEGVALARTAIASGAADRVLQRLRSFSDWPE